MKKSFLAGLIALPLLTAVVSTAAVADTYPSKPIRMVLPFPAGGGTDIIARIVGQRVGEALGQPVVIDNRSGASGIIGTDMVAKAAADGHTLLFTNALHAINPVLYKTIPYDPIKSFTPISLVGMGLYVVVLHPSVPAKNMQELIAYAKANPGKLNGVVAANGSPGHIALEQFKRRYKLEIQPVSYKGTGFAVADLAAGHVQLMFASYPAVQQFITSGKLRAIATTTQKRSPITPDLPTTAEAGVPDFVYGDWYVVMAPANTDKAIVNRLHGEFVKALANTEVRERLQGIGADIVGSSPQQTDAFIKKELEILGNAAREAQIKME